MDIKHLAFHTKVRTQSVREKSDKNICNDEGGNMGGMDNGVLRNTVVVTAH
jgi:hypothetical protein